MSENLSHTPSEYERGYNAGHLEGQRFVERRLRRLIHAAEEPEKLPEPEPEIAAQGEPQTP